MGEDMKGIWKHSTVISLFASQVSNHPEAD